MKEQEIFSLLDDLLKQILQYKNQSELFSALSIIDGEKNCALEMSQSLNDIFESFRRLIRNITMNKESSHKFSENSENLISKIDHSLSILEKLPDLEEEYKSNLKSLIESNKTTFNQLCEHQFDVAEYLSNSRYYAQMITIIDAG
jgi:hypothetical protein